MISCDLITDWFENKIKNDENTEFLSELEILAFELASEHGRPYTENVAVYKAMIWQILYSNSLILINI
jgi:hypothetical protein